MHCAVCSEYSNISYFTPKNKCGFSYKLLASGPNEVHRRGLGGKCVYLRSATTGMLTQTENFQIFIQSILSELYDCPVWSDFAKILIGTLVVSFTKSCVQSPQIECPRPFKT